MKKPLLIAICGPTASGKTALSIELAQWLKTDILSFDSRQFYRELLIGSAPPSPEELKLAKHHFIQQLSINEDYNAGKYEREAIEFLDGYFKSHNSIVAVGGSGMYIKALEKGFDELPKVDETLRNELNSLFKNEGLKPLQEELKAKDPAYYKTVDTQNQVRLIRALEVIRTSGQPFSAQRSTTSKERNFTTVKIGIDYPREELYEKINLRVDLMMKSGLLEEVKALHPFKGNNALHTVGYTELFKHLDGEWDLE